MAKQREHTHKHSHGKHANHGKHNHMYAEPDLVNVRIALIKHLTELLETTPTTGLHGVWAHAISFYLRFFLSERHPASTKFAHEIIGGVCSDLIFDSLGNPDVAKTATNMPILYRARIQLSDILQPDNRPLVYADASHGNTSWIRFAERRTNELLYTSAPEKASNGLHECCEQLMVAHFMRLCG